MKRDMLFQVTKTTSGIAESLKVVEGKIEELEAGIADADKQTQVGDEQRQLRLRSVDD